jgi:hypothetical protein
MLENALQCSPVQEAAKMDFVKNWLGVIVGLVLVAISILGIVWCPNEVGIKFSDALLVAGIVTVTVDPFLKRRLLKEASTDIFHHLLGFDLPLEIRETLRDFLLKNRIFAKDVSIEANVQSVGSDSVEVSWSVNQRIVAAASDSFNQHVSFEESEHGSVLEATVSSLAHPEWNYNKKSPILKPEHDEPMVSSWTGDKIELKRGDELTTLLKFTTHGPKSGHVVYNFSRATINPRIRVYSSDDLEIASSRSDQRNADEYIHRKVFVPGDHIQVRWKPKKNPSN